MKKISRKDWVFERFFFLFSKKDFLKRIFFWENEKRFSKSDLVARNFADPWTRELIVDIQCTSFQFIWNPFFKKLKRNLLLENDWKYSQRAGNKNIEKHLLIQKLVVSYSHIICSIFLFKLQVNQAHGAAIGHVPSGTLIQSHNLWVINKLTHI